MVPIVAVGKGHKGTFHDAQSFVSTSIGANVLRHSEPNNAWVRKQVVVHHHVIAGGVIVDHDEFEVGMGLVEDGIDRQWKGIVPLVHRHDDADQWPPLALQEGASAVVLKRVKIKS